MVFRRMRDGRTIVVSRPNFSNRVFSQEQLTHQSRLCMSGGKNTFYLRRTGAANPKTRLQHRPLRLVPRPVIHEVSQQAGLIRVNVTDNVQVAKVLVTILDNERSEGQTLEQGEAARVNDSWWEFETAAPIEGKVIVEAFDLAGNCTKHKTY